jgi:hypothetical protein
MTRLHFAVDGTWFDYDANRYEQVPCCGNDFRRRKKLIADPELVNCPVCRELCGFDEGLTVCEGDPFLNRRAA